MPSESRGSSEDTVSSESPESYETSGRDKPARVDSLPNGLLTIDVQQALVPRHLGIYDGWMKTYMRTPVYDWTPESLQSIVPKTYMLRVLGDK